MIVPGGDRILICWSDSGSAQAIRDLNSGALLAEMTDYQENPDLERMRGAWRGAWAALRGEPAPPTVPAPLYVSERGILIPVFSSDGNLLVSFDWIGDGFLSKKRRPEPWWGLAWLPESWLTAVFALLLVWSLARDVRTLRMAAT